MGVKVKETKFKGLYIIESDIFEDRRGTFMESYNRREFAKHGIDVDFVQDNVSRSIKGTLRGLHYQLEPHAQGKLVRVTYGSVFDVAVDIRSGSPTYGDWFGYELSDQNRHALYIPPGFAHGFLVLSDEAEFAYKCTTYYNPAVERTIAWNDPQIGIRWPLEPNPELLSKRDGEAPTLDRAEINSMVEPR